jgi:hypothetical protein
MVWFRDLGFHNNPFSIKPAVFNDNVMGYEKIIDEISYGILNNKIIVLEGEYGNGKSTILRRLVNDFGGKKQVIYYSCNRIESRLNIKSLLNGRYGFIGRMFDIKPKDMIFLLDEAQELGEKDFQKIHSYYQEGYLKSVVLVGKGIDKARIPEGLKSNLSEISLDSINSETAVKVIRKRIGNLALINDEMIKEIFQLSNNNVRLLLKNCEEACRFAVQTGRKTVNTEVLTQVFKTFNSKSLDKKVTKKPEAKKSDSKKPEAKKESAKHDEKSSSPKKDEKKAASKKSKVSDVKIKEVEEMAVPVAPNAKGVKDKTVYNPDRYKDVMQASAEELLDKGTDELFD